LYKNLYKIVKLIQEYIKKYYNFKKFKGLDLKEGDKMWLLYKILKLKQLNKKLDHVKIKLFKIIVKILEIIYRLNLPIKIKFYLV